MSLSLSLSPISPSAEHFSKHFTASFPSPNSGPRSWFARLGASFARQSLLAVLDGAVHVGRLTITDTTGETFYFGQALDLDDKHADVPDVHLTVVDESFWARLLMSGDLGFSEAYMLGEVHVNDLKSVFDLWLINESGLSALAAQPLLRVTSAISGRANAWLGQTRAQARLNAIAGYDQSNALFRAFLSRDMTYSCALWGPEQGGVRGDLLPGGGLPPAPPSTPTPAYNGYDDDDDDDDDTGEDGPLEAAQQRKLQHVIRRLRLQPGDRVLEFGSGWGGLAIAACLAVPGVEFDALTLSAEQKALADARVAARGLAGRVRVHLLDYREMPAEWAGRFDAFVSVEMLEHVGTQYYGTYFRLVDWALKKERARAVVSCTTFPEHRYSAYQPEDFMRRYIWPNSSLPSAITLINAANTGSQGRFHLEVVESQGEHYPRTLREWGRRLERNLTPATMAATHPSLLDRARFAAFKRKWQYLFAYAASGFARGYIGLHMMTFARPTGPSESCD